MYMFQDGFHRNEGRSENDGKYGSVPLCDGSRGTSPLYLRMPSSAFVPSGGLPGMSVEQYSNGLIVVAVADGPSDFKVWLREEAPADLASDLRWLCEEYMESHVVVDLGDRGRLEPASYGLMLDLQRLVEESDCRLVLCGLSPHVKWRLRCMRLLHEFDTFDTREAAIKELVPQEAY